MKTRKRILSIVLTIATLLLLVLDIPVTAAGTVSYTHLTLPTTSRRQRQMCIRDSSCDSSWDEKGRRFVYP